MELARPTIRCLREDLHLSVPPVDEPLDELNHPLIVKVNKQFRDADTPHVAVRIIGSVPETLTVTVLDLVPGCDLDGWFPEYSLPERPLDPAEQAWSNLMDPIEAAKLLDHEA